MLVLVVVGFLNYIVTCKLYRAVVLDLWSLSEVGMEL